MKKPSALLAIKLLYAMFFASFAVYYVFINAHFREIGLSGVQIGVINGFAPLVAAVSVPLWALLTDQTGRARLMLGIAAITAALAVGGMGFTRSFALLVPLTALWSMTHNAISPMLDSANIRALGGNSQRFARQRMWGSISFVIVALGAGWLMERTGLGSIFILYPFFMILLVLLLPLLAVQPAAPRSSLRADLADLVRQRAWLLFMLSVIPMWMGANNQYAMLTVYLKDLGASPALFGQISALGAAVEVVLMFFSDKLIQRVGVKRLLVLAYGFFVARMVLYALMPRPEWAAPIALMHMLTFAPYYVAGVVYISQLVPERLRTTGQALLYTAMNVASVISSPIAGAVYDRFGGHVLFAGAAGLCALGLVILLAGFRKRESLSP